MKKQLLFVIAAFCMGLPAAMAQDSGVSVGLEIALPLGDFGEVYTLGYGASGAYELGVSDNLGVTGTIGYILLAPDSDISDFVKRASMMPIQVGANYYLDQRGSGLYAGAQVGIHNMSVTTEDIEILGVTIEGETESESDLSLAPQVGFCITDQLSVDARYQLILSADDDIGAENSSYFGIRAAYRF